MDVVRNFLARYERTREEELSLEEYLDLCKRDPLAYATAAERMLKAIGEPRDGRHAQRPAAVAHLRQQGHQASIPAFAEFYGMEDADRAGRVLLPPRRAGAGRKEADPLPARPGRRRQELDRRAPEAADGAGAVLRDQGFAGERVAAGPVRHRRGRRRCSRRNTASRARYLQRILSPWAVKRLEEFGGDIRKFKVVKRHPVDPQADAASPRPSRATRTTRTSPRWSARSTSASSRPMPRTTPTPTATRAACAWPTRACWSSSRCSRRRSRCCTRC